MEHLALGLVWLLGMLVSISPMFQQFFIKKKALDMAPNSFDDQYDGCSYEMEKKLKELNRTEFEKNEIYAEAWKKAIVKLQSRKTDLSVLQPVEAIALMAYTLNDTPLHKELNEAVHEAGSSREQYLHNFPFKVLHFLLTKALRKLRVDQCTDVYRGVKKTFTAQLEETVRFGQFTSTSLKRWRAEKYGQGTIFLVNTCHGAVIRNFALSFDHHEVLIPPFETFKVTSVSQKGYSRIIQLQSNGVHSNYSCEYVKGHSVTLAPLWGFLLAATALVTAVGI